MSLTKVRTSTLDAIIPSGGVGVIGGVRLTFPAATTIDLTAVQTLTQNLLLTGSGNITGFIFPGGQTYFVSFASVMTLKNSTQLYTNKGADIVTVPGDSCVIRAIQDNVAEIILYSRIALV